MASEMHASITLELVTPAFIGGAEPRGKPEFRIPSLRGALRYWWRALFGAGVEDWTTLLQKESELFGSTDKASAVQLRLHKAATPTPKSYSKLTQGKPGISYLWFAARKTKNDPERQALPDGSRYVIDASIHYRSNPQKLWEQFYAALWLLTHLGGIGTRARRGAGGIQVVDIQSSTELSNLPPLPIRATTVEQFGEELQSGIQQLRRNVLPDALSTQPTFHLLHPEFAEICLIERSFASWQEALNFIGSSLQSFRKSRFSEDARIVSDLIFHHHYTPNRTIHRAAFGLPLPFFFRRERRGATVDPRRGSPLFIRIVKLAGQQRYAIVLTFFKAQFLDNDHRPSIRGQKFQIPSYAPIEQWLDTLNLFQIELNRHNEG